MPVVCSPLSLHSPPYGHLEEGVLDEGFDDSDHFLPDPVPAEYRGDTSCVDFVESLGPIKKDQVQRVAALGVNQVL